MNSNSVLARTVKLNNGTEIPIIGLGTWKSDPGVLTQTVKDAIDVGYRHLDCALIYENEKEVGAGVKAKIEEGVVKREDLFLTSKLWNSFHRPDLVVPSLKTSLKDLGVDFVDLYLIHWPVAFKEGNDLSPKDADGKFLFSDVDFCDTWKAMEDCVHLGLTKSIGLSNFNSQQIDQIMKDCKIKPVMNQVECHPYLNQNKLIEFCKSKEIAITAYSPLGSPTRPWVGASDPRVMEDPTIIEIGKKYAKSPAQVLLRWQIQRGVIVVPKTVSANRLQENFDIFDFALDDDEISKIGSMDNNSRGFAVEWFKDSKDYPFGIEF